MSIILGLLGLSFLVFFHETGHFIAAKIFGVKVEAFSIGMGPVLLHHTFRGTDYRLSLIPMGGYCSMKGEKDFKNAVENDLSVMQTESDSFYGIHPLKRILIAFAGPLFNFIFAIIAFTIIALMGYKYYSAGTVVSMADELYENITSPAHESGLETGDEILSIDGNKMNDFSDLAKYISVNPDKDLKITVKRNGEELTFTVHSLLDKEEMSGKIGIVASKDSIVEREYPKHSFFPAVAEGVKKTFELCSISIKSIKILFKGVKVTEAVSGPARITSILGSSMKDGFSQGFKTGIITTLEFLSLISVSLFLTNLLPIPVLDGGLILTALIELFTRKKLKPKTLYRLQLAGAFILVLIFIVAITGDVLYFIRNRK